MYAWLVAFGVAVLFAISPAYAQQVINVTETEPCFLNQTAGWQAIEQCGLDEDWLQAALLMFEYVTGGYFTFIIVSVIVFAVYMKYHKWVYTLLVAVLYLPMAVYSMPEWVWPVAIMLVSAGIIAAIYKTLTRGTSEYN